MSLQGCAYGNQPVNLPVPCISLGPVLQQAKKLCRDIMKAVRQLQEKRDMSINECKLTIAIEDPRSRERREALGIEVSL